MSCDESGAVYITILNDLHKCILLDICKANSMNSVSEHLVVRASMLPVFISDGKSLNAPFPIKYLLPPSYCGKIFSIVPDLFQRKHARDKVAEIVDIARSTRCAANRQASG
jgi:hypothetical protein